jgi:hypothetical protein
VPSQSVLELKYQYGQPLYRFEVDPDTDFVVDLRDGKLGLKSLKDGCRWSVRRRPLFALPLVSNRLVSLIFCYILWILYIKLLPVLLSLFLYAASIRECVVSDWCIKCTWSAGLGNKGVECRTGK